MTTPGSNQHWLIRTTSNVIAGPYSQDQVRNLIKAHQLHHQDEICSANGYWFFLHEQEEVHRQLGIDIPPEYLTAVNPDEEDSTMTDADRTERAIPPVSDDQAEIPDLPEEARESRMIRREETPQGFHQPQIMGIVERQTIWKISVAVLTIATLVLFGLIIRLLSQS